MSQILVLRCKDCENMNCVYSHEYIPEGSLEGCTRILTDDAYAKYEHLLLEKWPNAISMEYPRETISQIYKEIVTFLDDETYAAPIGQKLDKRGKVKNLTNLKK